MGILWIILIGAVAGIIARLLAPGQTIRRDLFSRWFLASRDHFLQRSSAKQLAGIVLTKERGLSVRRSAR